ncbi:MAG: 4Fe-4S dicluster domain-containing protein [Nitrososphaeria archaeon]|nr:4Fe-4S dicluster domain-containing protein [Nitrososphaeria archaeon]MDW7986561.1 4Fe-4S dicluster domain-containing protein [Nitrososphaerota archaeon]
MGISSISLKTIKIDPNLKSEILNSIINGDTSKCTQCGICTSGCPLGEFIKPHRIIKLANLGLKEQLLNSKEIWLCTTCFTCSERCPQEVDPANIIFMLKNLASRHEYAPKGFIDICMNIIETGRAIKIGVGREKERERLGLPKIPVVDIQKTRVILEEVGLLKVLGGAKK